MRREPELRFPEFAGEWEEKRLGDLVTFYKGKNLSKSDISEEGIPCILYGELYTTYGEVIREVKSKTDTEKQLFFSEKNDVLIPSSGETAMDISCASVVLEQGVALGGDLNVLRPNGGTDGSYLSYSLNSQKKEIATLAQGISVVHLYAAGLKTLTIDFPTLPEQQKIASFLSTFDERIELQQSLVANLKAKKKWLLKQIFERKLRFKDEDGNEFPEWEEKRLGNLGSFGKSYSYSRSAEGEGEYKHIHYGDIHKKYNGYIDETLNVPSIVETKEFELVEDGDLLIADASEDYKDLGKTLEIRDTGDRKIIAGLHTMKFTPCESLNSGYYRYYTQSEEYSKFLRKTGTGISVLGLSKTNLGNMIFKVPTLPEQKLIASFLSTFDEKIEKETELLEALKLKKKWLLQKMFV